MAQRFFQLMDIGFIELARPVFVLDDFDRQIVLVLLDTLEFMHTSAQNIFEIASLT